MCLHARHAVARQHSLDSIDTSSGRPSQRGTADFIASLLIAWSEWPGAPCIGLAQRSLMFDTQSSSSPSSNQSCRDGWLAARALSTALQHGITSRVCGRNTAARRWVVPVARQNTM
jgi:hypothetical protein